MDNQSEDRNNGWWNLLGFLFPIVGWVLWGVWHKEFPERAYAISTWAWIGFGISFALSILRAL